MLKSYANEALSAQPLTLWNEIPRLPDDRDQAIRPRHLLAENSALTNHLCAEFARIMATGAPSGEFG
jgi:hypothetical protein